MRLSHQTGDLASLCRLVSRVSGAALLLASNSLWAQTEDVRFINVDNFVNVRWGEDLSDNDAIKASLTPLLNLNYPQYKWETEWAQVIRSSAMVKISRGNIRPVFGNPSNTRKGDVATYPSKTSYVLWNCTSTPAELKYSYKSSQSTVDEQASKQSQTDTRTLRVSVKMKGSFGAASAEGEASAQRVIERYAEETWRRRNEEAIGQDFAFPAQIRAYSGLKIEQTQDTIIEVWDVRQPVTVNFDVYVQRLSNAALAKKGFWFPAYQTFTAGMWSDIADEKRRTMDAFAEVEIPVYTRRLRFEEVPTGGENGCKAAKSSFDALDEGAGDRFFSVGPQISSLAPAPVAKQATTMAALSKQTVAEPKALLVTLTPQSSSFMAKECSGTTEGQGQLDEGEVSLDFKVEIEPESCPDSADTSGRILYGLRVRDAAGEAQILTGYSSFWNSRQGNSFTHSDQVDIAKDTQELLEVVDEEILDCTCLSD